MIPDWASAASLPAPPCSLANFGQAWGLLESRAGDSERARELFGRAAKMRVGVGELGDLLCHWAEEERQAGNVGRARELLVQARGLAEMPGERPNKSLHVSGHLSGTLYNFTFSPPDGFGRNWDCIQIKCSKPMALNCVCSIGL